jgi:hypothetical protein
MPIGVLTCQHNWLPTIPEALETRRIPHVGWHDNPQYLFTLALLEALPSMSAKAIEWVDHKPIDGVVSVEPAVFHPWSQNVSTFRFELQSGNAGLANPDDQKARRAAIAGTLRRRIADFVRGHYITRPIRLEAITFDIESAPLSRSGYALRYEGDLLVEKASWGIPEASA